MATTVTRQDSVHYSERLESGLQLVGELMPGVQSAAIVYWVNTGTRDEPLPQMGVSHFLEHMAFRRTARFSGEEIDRAFEEMGADHNAATWLEMTFYWARVLSENVPWAIEVLTELVQPALQGEDFDQERNVILEEIARYRDLPNHVLLAHFMEDFFGHHPLSRETLGRDETIKALTVEQMRDYWGRRYGTHNVTFAIAGNFDWPGVRQQVASLTREWGSGEASRQLAPATFEPGFHVYQEDQFVQEQFALGVPCVKRGDERYYAAAVLATILGDDTGSRLFWALQQTGLAESATAQIMDFEDNGLMLVHIGTEPQLAAEALRVARSELQRLQDFDVRQDELDRAKAKLNTSIIIGGESANERVMALIRSWLTYGRLETLEELRQKIEAVTLDDLRALVDAFPVSPGQVITAVGPVPPSDIDPGLQDARLFS